MCLNSWKVVGFYEGEIMIHCVLQSESIRVLRIRIQRCALGTVLRSDKDMGVGPQPKAGVA